MDKRIERSNSIMSSRSIDNEELMVIEISFGKNKTDSVIVHYGDNPITLAEVRVAMESK
jgi:hypothetical protein